MNNIIYEKVNLNPKLPALLGYFGKENSDVKRYFYSPPHWHRSIEIIFVTEGEIVGVINGKKIKASSGEFILVNSGDVHEVEKYEGDVCEGVLMVLSYDFLKKVYQDIDNVYFDIMSSDIKKDRLIEIFLEIKDFYLKPKELDYIIIHSYIYEILHILLTNYKSHIKEESRKTYFKYRERQKEILVYISDNYKEELTLEHISNEFFMSSEYFSRKFHKWFGVTYKVYLNNFRLSKAYEDIINTNDNIQDIAFSHGFSNVKSFISIFKQKYNMTPYKYRQSYKESRIDIKESKK